VARALAWPALFLALGCSRAAPGDYWLLLGTGPGSGVRLAETEVSPSAALVERRADRAGVALLLRRGAGPVRVSAPGGCPLVVEAPKLPGVDVVEHRIEPLFDLGARVRVVGPESAFEIHATERCAEAKRSSVELSVKGGAPLDDVRVEQGGRRLTAKTRGVSHRRERAAWGIVPVSAEHRGASIVAARGRLPDGSTFERTLEVAALARASGLPSVAVGHGVLLAGSGFHLEKIPEGSRVELRVLGELIELVPDVRGDFALADAEGRKLVIQSGRYDEMPLDCGRSDCHAALSASARHSPMTRALAADLGGAHPLESVECALACHATGEPGTNDGGFSHVQAELDLAALPSAFAELPRALRRLGGVGCLACHGPARVPPESARWAVLRSDVCAVCHDAPPRYGHGAAFATTRMAVSDRDPRTREQRECARCHTAWGSLAEPARRPPAEVGAFGLGCAACHAVHGPDEASSAPHALLRASDVRAVLPGAPASALGPSRVCIGCHSPGSGPLPEASAAAIWAGRSGVEPKTGAALEGPAPHASDPRGCLRCHDSGPAELERGKNHAFVAAPASCAPCHADQPMRRPELASDARAILDEIVPLARGRKRTEPFHAGAIASTLPPARARALKNVLLVLEDPAADVHNPAYARRLLDAARSATATSAEQPSAEGARP
jgi:hypothetical protein